MATDNKHRARTNRLSVKLHRFIDYVTGGEVNILPIGKLDQESAYLTKAVI